ncbi:MAG: chromosome segregation protein SMC [Chloroflexi bacterium]|nr:chromosome segregation protein SMC [Chloroflexota bacterium]
MRIKRLQLQGYKTFATQSEFLFDDGITTIVGPNGSGKSNIADALRWVLGEQSYRTLRGKRTTDMIFAGSQSRPRAGMAQVMLTLDNSGGWLPIDYTEVEIGRRAYRSGENEYLLNGQKVRLKDITDLLATSGLAQRTYTIIGQGLVDQALSLRSEERRALFEEAAGINHYKSRRAETLRRLQETQRNLLRVHDILAEIRPRLTSLKRQATRARNYEQIAADLNHLLYIWYGFQWEEAKKQLRQVRETAVTAETTWQSSRRKLRVRQENSDDLRRRIHRLQQQAAETQNQRDDLRDQLETARREVAILHERQAANKRRLAEWEQERPFLEQQAQSAQNELGLALADLEAAQKSIAQDREQLQQFNLTFQEKQAEIGRWQKTLRDTENQQRDTQNRVAQTQGQLNQLRERLQEKEAENSSVDDGRDLIKVKQEIEQFTVVLQSSQNKASELRQKRDTVQQERQTLVRELKQMRREHRQAEQAINHRRRDLARLEAQADMLEQMRLTEVRVDKDVPVKGHLAQFITIPDEYQTAVAAALQARLTTLLLPDEAALWALLQDQDENTAVSALALNSIQAPQNHLLPHDKEIIGWADAVVQVEEGLFSAVHYLLGPVLLAQSDQAAYRLAKKLPSGTLAVSPSGLVVHAGGLVERNGQQQNSILARESERRQAEEALRVLQTELAEMETAVSTQNESIQQKQGNVDALQKEESQLGRLRNETGQQLAQVQRDIDRRQQQQTFMERQWQNELQEIGRLQLRLEEMEDGLEVHFEQLIQLETAVSEAQSQLDALPVAEAQQQRQNLQQAINASQTIVAGRQAVVDSRRATLNQFAGQLTRLTERHARLTQEQQQLSLDEKERERQRLQTKLDELDGRLKPMRSRLAELGDELVGLEEGTAVFQKETHDAETIYTQTKIAYTQRQNHIENLQERIQADLGVVALHYDEDQTGPTPLPIAEVHELPVISELPDDIEAAIQQYRGQMQRMGAINPDAPEEYQETQARFDFMKEQVEDLNQTEAQLRQVIADLDELTSRAFAETVAKVDAVFGGTFTQLFGGGVARLVLTDPDDLTISGVDIIARLPNRREQALGLLSGGERSLTAVALIFSLLKVSPTPFCVLDEVDAALDEANINRFRDLLRELSLNTQFIVITHNRGTVQVARTIYGISMGNDSASQAISIKPEDYIKQPELI